MHKSRFHQHFSTTEFFLSFLETAPDQLRLIAQQCRQDIPELLQVIPFLDISMQQDYVVKRIRGKSCASSFFHFLAIKCGDFPTMQWLIAWLIDWWIDWLFDRLIDWLIDWLLDRSIDWLIERCGISWVKSHAHSIDCLIEETWNPKCVLGRNPRRL